MGACGLVDASQLQPGFFGDIFENLHSGDPFGLVTIDSLNNAWHLLVTVADLELYPIVIADGITHVDSVGNTDFVIKEDNTWIKSHLHIHSLDTHLPFKKMATYMPGAFEVITAAITNLSG